MRSAVGVRLAAMPGRGASPSVWAWSIRSVRAAGILRDRHYQVAERNVVLVPVANGRDLARRIPGAQADFIDGMGHDLPQALLGRIAQGIARNALRAS